MDSHNRLVTETGLTKRKAFAVANVEDYEVLSRVLVDHHEDPRQFFAERLPALGRKRISRAEASFCAED